MRITYRHTQKSELIVRYIEKIFHRNVPLTSNKGLFTEEPFKLRTSYKDGLNQTNLATDVPPVISAGPDAEKRIERRLDIVVLGFGFRGIGRPRRQGCTHPRLPGSCRGSTTPSVGLAALLHL